MTTANDIKKEEVKRIRKAFLEAIGRLVAKGIWEWASGSKSYAELGRELGAHRGQVQRGHTVGEMSWNRLVALVCDLPRGWAELPALPPIETRFHAGLAAALECLGYKNAEESALVCVIEIYRQRWPASRIEAVANRKRWAERIVQSAECILQRKLDLSSDESVEYLDRLMQQWGKGYLRILDALPPKHANVLVSRRGE